MRGGGVKPPEDFDETPDEGDEKGEETPGEGDDNNGGDIPGDSDSNDGGNNDGENDDGKDDNSNAGGNEGGTDDNSNDGENEGGTGGDSNDGGNEGGTGGDSNADEKKDGEDDTSDSGNSGDNGEETSGTAETSGGSENSNGTDASETSDSADNRTIAGFSIETGSFVMPVYASENLQDGLTAGTLTDDGNDTGKAAAPADSTGAADQTDTQPQSDTGGTNVQTDTREKTVVIGNVTWQSDPAYDGSVEEVYTFTAVLPEGYALSEGVSLPQITVTVGNGIDAVIQTLLDRIAALPDAQEYREKEPDIDNWEGDEEDYEEAYTEWMEVLQAYAKEALAILEEIESLTQEQEAQIPQEALDKLAAWAEIAETLSESTMVMAADHTHNGIAFEAWTSTSSLPISGNYYLTNNVTLDKGTSYHISNTLNLCLNGYTIKGDGRNTDKHIFQMAGGTLNLYDCNGSGGVSLVNTSANVVAVAGGSTFNLYGGTLYQGNSGLSTVSVTVLDSDKQGGTVNIYEGSITGGSNGINVNPNLTNASVAIKGGSIDSGTNGVRIQSGNATISGGAVKGGTYAVKVENASTVTIAGNATLTNPISTPNAVIASGMGVAGLNKTCRIAFTDVADGTIVVQNSTDTEHYQLDSTTYGLAAKDGNLVAVNKNKIHSVTYNKNGGTIENEDRYTSYAEGVGLTLPTPTREHYTFGGWYENFGCTGTAVTSIPTTATENKTYYAKWTADTYTVTYNKNSGTIANESNYISYAYGTGLTLPTPTRTGYTFGGWYENSGFTGNKVTSISANATGNKTYYAKWTANTYTVTYNKNSGTITNESNYTKYTYGTGLTLPTPTRTGYTFGGWYENSGFTGTAVTVISANATGNKTYYAKWTANTYTVTYNKNSGTITNETSYTSYTYGTGLTLPTPTRTGYTFGGWYENSGCTGTAVTVISTTATGNKTYYATWTANTYKVTFDYQGATGGTGTTEKSVTYNGTYGTLPAPVKTGYTFKGWFTQADGKGSQVKDTTAVKITAAQTLYAYWVDAEPPAKPVLKSGVTLPTDWTNTQTTIPLTLSDNEGVTELWVKIDSGSYAKVSPFTSGTVSYDYPVSEGNHTYRFKAKDAAGNESPESTFTVMLDTRNPTFSKGPTVKNITSDSAAITFTPSEGGKAYWIVDPAGMPAGAQAVISGAQDDSQKGGVKAVTGGTSADIAVTDLTPGAVHKVYVVLEDAAGNLSAVKEAVFGTWPEAPAITADDLIKDYEKETVKVPDRFGDVEVYTDPDDPSGSVITPGQDGCLPVEPGKSVYIRYPEKTQDGVTIPPSDGVKIDIPGRPAAPPAKEVAVIGTTVKVKDPADGEEYTLVPKGQEPDWNDADRVNESGAFTGLDPNKEYDLYVRKKATEDAFASESAKTPVRTHVTINEPQITGDGKGEEGNTAPRPDHPDEGGTTVTYTGTYGEEYTPVIIVNGKEIIPGSDTSDAEGSEMTWDEEDKKGEWKYVYTIPDGAAEADITVEFKKRSVTGITAQPGSLTLSADSGANRSAAEVGDIMPLTAYLKEKCSVEAAYDNRTTGAVPADDAVYTVTDTFAPKGAAYHYTISVGSKNCTATLTVTPVTASVRNPDTVMQRQKDEGYTAQEAGAWLPAKLSVTYRGADGTVKTEELAVTWDTASLGADFGKTLGEKTVNGTVGLPAWATGTDPVSIVIRFVDKTPLGDGQIRLAMQDLRYGDKKLPDAQGSITVKDTNPVYAYLYSADGGTTWTAKEDLPKSAGGYIVPGEYQVKMTYTGDQYIGEKTTSFTVAKKQLTVQPGTLAAQDKNYDGTLNAVLKEDGKTALSGIVEGDNVTLGGTLTARFNEAGPKKNIPVTVTGFLLEGADSRCYELNDAALTLHATINNADGTPPAEDKKPGGGNNSGDNSNDGSSGDNDSGSGSSGGNNNGGKSTTPGDNNGGTKPGEKTGGTKPGGNNSGSNDGTKPGEKTDGTKPGGANGSEGNGSGTKPGSGSDPGEGETKIVPAVTEGGRIVIEDGTNDGKIATGNVPGMPGAGSDPQSGATGANAMRTMLRVGDGAVIVRVVCEETGITAGVPDTVAVANAVLTTEQVQLVNGGDTIEIRVEVRDITESVTEQDQKVIESALAQFREEQKGITVGMYVDISMFIKVGDGEWETVNTSDEPIGVVVGIPEGLRADGREYYIIRSHEGRCDILTDMDDAPDTITISTDRFSSYAIAYAETGETGAENGAKCGLCRICSTFLGVCCFVWLAVILAVTLIVILAAACRKKKKKAE